MECVHFNLHTTVKCFLGVQKYAVNSRLKDIVAYF